VSAQDTRIESVSGPANTWIIGDGGEVIVVDPGEDASAVLAAVGDREILAVICTHAHARHCQAAVEVAKRDEALVAVHPADRQSWREVHDTDPDIEMEEDGRFEVGGVELEVLHAPGHSRGSVCLYCEDLEAVFTGDVVTQEGPVPTDEGFPNWGKQIDAIGAIILTLPPHTRILPGHGPELTVAAVAKRFDSWVVAGQSGQRTAYRPDTE
jgi:glyoxylase-like metal-dependent hydrolase (beta-lactamase superfamily II)